MLVYCSFLCLAILLTLLTLPAQLLEFKVQNVTLLLEEKLLFKLLQWAGVGQAQEEEEAKEEEIMNMLTLHRVSTPSSSKFGSVQIYFEHFKISDVELRVSMLTTSQLPEDLLKIKRHLGFPLVKFESPIYLDGVHQAHVLGDTGVYVDSLSKHYKGVCCYFIKKIYIFRYTQLKS